MTFTRDSTVGAVVDNLDGRALLSQYAPGLVNSPMMAQLRTAPVGFLLEIDAELAADAALRDAFLAQLASIDDAGAGDPRPEEPPIAPRDDYEPDTVAIGSAAVSFPATVTRWGVFEIELRGPSHGDPFVDVELTAEFRLEGAEGAGGAGGAGAAGGAPVTVGGFYDGAGVYRIRFSPQTEGRWTFRTTSTARSLTGATGSFEALAAAPDEHGPVRVADTFHFAHDDGTRHLPLGTTVYALTHQSDDLEQRTLSTLAASPFTKVRLCVFPKAYLYNTNEPLWYPFEGSVADAGDEASGWDTTRFVPEYFRHLEERIVDLARLGIQADVIVFHPYDRWGFSDLGRAADDRYVRYLVRRLQAYSNVWWSLANEYDLVWTKTVDDWERIASIVQEEDPTGHLLSIHNCRPFYDYSKPWITHLSVQRQDVYRTAEFTDEWRTSWGKPVVIDECAYEGDIDQGWGNITGEEMTRRFWEGAVRGGYVGHGETYLNDAEELWWSKGGELVGSSPARIGFLARIIAEAPGGRIDPLPSEWDVPWGGVAGRYLIAYFGFNRPRFRTFMLKPGIRYRADVLDTWDMTVTPVPGVFEGSFRLELPAKQYIAVRFTAL